MSFLILFLLFSYCLFIVCLLFVFYYCCFSLLFFCSSVLLFFLFCSVLFFFYFYLFFSYLFFRLPLRGSLWGFTPRPFFIIILLMWCCPYGVGYGVVPHTPFLLLCLLYSVCVYVYGLLFGSISVLYVVLVFYVCIV